MQYLIEEHLFGNMRNIPRFESVLKTSISILVLLFVSYALMWNMRKSEGIWITFDDVQVARSVAMAEELKAGQFPVRMLHNFGNGGGYMLFNFYSPLVYYATGLAVLAGLNPTNAVKIAFESTYIIAGLGMFFLLRSTKLNYKISVFGAFLLISSAYLNYDAYIRGALAELVAFALLPWLLYFYNRLRSESSLFYLCAISVLTAVLFYTHAITAFIALPMLLLWILVDFWRKVISLRLMAVTGASILVGLMLSASYLLPVVFERPYVRYDSSSFVEKDYKDSFKSLSETFALPRNDGKILQVSLGTGISLLLVLSIPLVLLAHRKKKISHKNTSILLFLALGLFISLYLQHYFSWPIWQYLPLVKLTQFPYRYLTITTVLAVYFIALGLSTISSKRLQAAVIGAAVVVTFFANRAYVVPVGYYFALEHLPADICATTTWDQEYLPIWTTTCLPKYDSRIATPSGELVILDAVRTNDGARVVSSGSGTLTLHKYYFPGWTARSQGQVLPITIATESGLMQVTLQSGESTTEFSFENTQVRRIGDILSLTLLVLVLSTLVFLAGKTVVEYRSKK